MRTTLPTNDSDNHTFKFVKIPACFSIPFGCQIVKRTIRDQSTADILSHLLVSYGDFWFMHIQTLSADPQQLVIALEAAKPFFPSLHKDQSQATSATSPLMGVSKDDAKLFMPQVNALLTACTDSEKQNTTTQIPVNVTPKS